MTAMRPIKPHYFIAILLLFAILSALNSSTVSPSVHLIHSESEETWQEETWQAIRRQLQAQEIGGEPPPVVSVCGRIADDIGSTQDLALQEKYATCPEHDPKTTPIVVLEGYLTYGRAGNQLRSFLRAMQYARELKVDLVIMYQSWAMDVMHNYFMASENDVWESEIERALCIEIVRRPEDISAERKVILKSSAEMFHYNSVGSLEDFVSSQLYVLRTMFQHHNTGRLGRDQYGNRVRDMCSGIDSLLSKESRSSLIYSVIHLRYMEGGPGRRWLERTAEGTGCDPRAAMEMEPDYIKSILAPLGMLDHPIVVITDGQNKEALRRLKADPDIGPNLLLVPKEASWIGGDITLATMANTFIGNPASSFSGFILKSRTALGFKNNYLYRAKNEDGEWSTVCDAAECFFMGDFSQGNTDVRTASSQMVDKRHKRGARLSLEKWQRHKEETDTDQKLKIRAYGPRFHKVYAGMRVPPGEWARQTLEGVTSDGAVASTDGSGP